MLKKISALLLVLVLALSLSACGSSSSAPKASAAPKASSAPKASAAPKASSAPAKSTSIQSFLTSIKMPAAGTYGTVKMKTFKIDKYKTSYNSDGTAYAQCAYTCSKTGTKTQALYLYCYDKANTQLERRIFTVGGTGNIADNVTINIPPKTVKMVIKTT